MALLIAHTFSRTTGGTRWKPYVVRVWYNIHINACPKILGFVLASDWPSEEEQRFVSGLALMVRSHALEFGPRSEAIQMRQAPAMVASSSMNFLKNSKLTPCLEHG